MPVAVPLMDSSGASVLKMTLLTPFGSLKSNSRGAANAVAATEAKMSAQGNLFFILMNQPVCFGFSARTATRRTAPARRSGRGRADPGPGQIFSRSPGRQSQIGRAHV